MQSAPIYKLPTGQPVWLLISSKKDSVFEDMRGEFGDKVRFVRLDPDSRKGEDAIEEFSIDKTPASVLADSKGRVIEKIEGVVDAADMRARLEALSR